MFKLSNSVKGALVTMVIMGFFAFSYTTFTSYQPKALKEVREVKGYSDISNDAFDLPTPRYAKGLSYDQTTISKKYTFQTEKSVEEIKSFYHSVLLEDDWRLKKEGSTSNFYTAEFRKDDFTVTLWSYYDNDVKSTYASLEIVEQ